MQEIEKLETFRQRKQKAKATEKRLRFKGCAALLTIIRKQAVRPVVRPPQNYAPSSASGDLNSHPEQPDDFDL